jgi:histidine triad (HIT) family protein
MAYDQNNIFAKIVRGEAPAFKVYEDDHTIAFMDIMPQVEGHVLVIPKEGAELIFDLSDAAAAALINTTKRVARAVKTVLGAPGVMLAQLNGSAAGQTVFHVHFHIMPRTAGIDLSMHAREKADFEKLKALAAKIEAAIKAGA